MANGRTGTGSRNRPGAGSKRPPYDELVANIEAVGYRAVGRCYGVSDNAIRKWVRQYVRERDAAAQRDAGAAR